MCMLGRALNRNEKDSIKHGHVLCTGYVGEGPEGSTGSELDSLPGILGFC